LSPPSDPAPPRLVLGDVTMCAVSSTNVTATIRALEASLAQIDVAEALLFTDADPAAFGTPISEKIRVVQVKRINSSEAYSHFILEKLVDHCTTSHCLIVQWDGHVLDASRWHPEFLDYDYIGASWPQFDDGHAVGNGGFSLRSRRLMAACRHPQFAAHHPEDVAICRSNRIFLEGLGLRFAPAALADLFSTERAGDPAASFGYHGVFLMPRVLGTEQFWNIYQTLNDTATLRHDFKDLLLLVLAGENGVSRACKMIARRLADARRWRRFDQQSR